MMKVKLKFPDQEESIMFTLPDETNYLDAKLPKDVNDVLIEDIESNIIELQRLKGRTVNFFELDWLAEAIEKNLYSNINAYNAYIFIENLIELKDLINAAHMPEKYVLFDNYPYGFTKEIAEKVYSGEHFFPVPCEELHDKATIQYLKDVCDYYPLILTPYGYFIKFREDTIKVYDGKHMYNNQQSICNVEVYDHENNREMVVHLPTSESYIKKVLEKAGIQDLAKYNIRYLEQKKLDKPLWASMQPLLTRSIYEVNDFLISLKDIEFSENKLAIACGILDHLCNEEISILTIYMKHIDDCSILHVDNPSEFVDELVKNSFKGKSEFLTKIYDSIDYDKLLDRISDQYDFIKSDMGMICVPKKEMILQESTKVIIDEKSLVEVVDQDSEEAYMNSMQLK